MKLDINDLRDLCLGREMDNGVMVVGIDCSDWREKYPQLTEYRIEVTSPGGIVYFAKAEMQGSILRWPITRLDTAAEGLGRYQVVATGPEDARKTSEHRALLVQHAMPDTTQGEPNDPSRPWTDAVFLAAQEAARIHMEELAEMRDRIRSLEEEISRLRQEIENSTGGDGVSDEDAT